jgi:hypothetical protein
MKYLNYISLIFITTILLTSCDKDKDDVQVEETESLIGLWKIERTFEEGEEVTINDCGLKSTVEFKADNTGVLNEHDFEDNICSNEIVTLGWEKVDSNTLRITIFDVDDPTYIDEITDFTYVIENELLTVEPTTEREWKAIYSKVN